MLVIFEDYTYNQFYPLSLNRPVFLLKNGIYNFLEQVKEIFQPYKCLLLMREKLNDFYSQYEEIFQFAKIDDAEEVLFISGQIILEERIDVHLNQAYTINDEVVAFKLKGSKIKELQLADFFKKNKLKEIFQQWGFSFKAVNAKKLNYLFELIDENTRAISRDYHILINKERFNQANIVDENRKQVFIHEKAKVHPGCYFLSEEGPIIIDEEAEIKPLSVIEGPCYIGKKVLVDGAKIRGGTSIFTGCKVAGEIEASIILDYSNKHHDGFLGHSYIGSFVNFGALATNSDLKNNYGEVSLNIHDEIIKTKSMKIGAFIGDYVKLGIGSLINTGSIIGLGCNLYFDGEIYPKYLPSFLWGGKRPFQEYDFDKFIETCKKVSQRRNCSISKKEISLLRHLFEQEKETRKKFLVA